MVNIINTIWRQSCKFDIPSYRWVELVHRPHSTLRFGWQSTSTFCDWYVQV